MPTFDELVKAIAVLQGLEDFDPSQKRDDTGQWTDEGGSSGGKSKSKGGLKKSGKLPDIDESPTASLNKRVLQDADLPDTHYDGLNKIGFVEGQFVKTSGPKGVIEAYGIYDPSNETITLASNARSEQNDMFNRLGTGNIEVIGGATVLHEMGHHVHISKLTDEASDEWAHISSNGQRARISSYARTNQGEHFAEAYREYARGGTHRSKLKNLEPESYKFMASLFRNPNRFLPDGQKADTSTFWARYNPSHEGE